MVFVFPGQGSQWAGMGRELAASSPVFAARLAECGQALAPYTDWSLDEVVHGRDGAPGLDRVDVVQPVLWAVMVSLAAFWQAAGVEPDAVVGHSQGEIAAAVVAGILTLEDAARIVALRSRALTALSGRGGMLSIAESADAVAARARAWDGWVSVAAVNGPGATVLSGDTEALEVLLADCERDGVRARMLPVDYASHGPQVDELREEILTLLDGVAPRPARVPMVSAMTGEFLEGPELDAGYWYASLRAPVEFSRAVEVLGRAGHGVFVETSAHPVLTAPVTATLEGLPGVADPVVTGTLRREDGGPARALASLAEAHVRGVAVDWTAVLAEAERVQLPTYAFAAQRFWPAPVGAATGDVSSAGLDPVGHPLLGASVQLAEGEGLVVTGRLSLRAQPWLADYAVAGTVVLPGTALAELAVVAGHQAGCPRIEKLTLTAPLVLSADHPTQVQITLGAAEDGQQPDHRTVQIYARAETPADPANPADEAPAWTWHASGVLAPARPAESGSAREFLVWPPADAEPLDLTGLADAQTATGLDYGPAFRGLRAAWRQGDDVLAEVALPEPAAAEAGVFGLHPALLDAAFQAAALHPEQHRDPSRPAGETRIPFSWTDVSVYAPGASRLRVRLRPGADGWSLTAADGTGAPVASVGALVLRPVTAAQLRIAGNTLRDALFGLTWAPVPDPTVAVTGPWAVAGTDTVGLGAGLRAVGATVTDHPDLAALAAAVDSGAPVPQFVVVCPQTAARADERPGDAVRRTTGAVDALVRQWLAVDALSGARLVLVTRGAVATGPEQPAPELTGAAVWGLVRAAQAGHPGRLVLADLPAEEQDGAADRLSMLAASLTSDEPELALRGDTVYGRRLTRPTGGVVPTEPPAERTPGTVLVTGGPGTAAARAARHLAASGRAAAVTVATATGPAAPGAADLAAALATAGADVRIAAHDLAAPTGDWSALLAGHPGAPLTTVLHQGDDDTPTAPDAAWNLHRLTAGLDLDAFVLYSTLAAALGSPGAGDRAGGPRGAQAGFLQALAAQRQAAGLPAVALAWGPPTRAEQPSALPELAALAELAEGDALALLDLVLERDEAVLVPARLNLGRLRAPADAGAGREPAPIWRGLVGTVTATETEADHSEVAEALRGQLATLSPEDQERTLLTLVRAHVAAVLGQGSPEAIEPRRAFSDLGFDSMIAVELRNRLNAATGLKLPATVVFDYPTTAAVAEYLRESLVLDGAGGADAEEETLRRILATTAISRFRDAGILDALLRLADPDSATPESDGDSRAEDIDGLDAESLVRMALDSESTDY
ncbi:acyltransferase domain-containing protein [Streptacidiphilus sp. P02-A3a]|nr:acyltransferase domain-containing protein [Streptacidiphilus sp. P02-A3a]